MTFTPETQQAINKVVSSVSFPNDPTCVLTPRDRANRLEESVKKMLTKLNKGKVCWWCSSCGSLEYLLPAHENPMHRHDAVLYLLKRTT